MAMPALASVAQRMYNILEPLHRDDVTQEHALAIFVGGLGMPLQVAEDLGYGGEEDVVWYKLFDPFQIPASGLDWLAQFTGIRLNPILTESQKRQAIADRLGWERGTPAAIVSSVQIYLTGTKSVQLLERDTSAYHFTVNTRESETPLDNVPLIEAAIASQKAIGLLFDYNRIPDWTYDDLDAAYATYDAIDAAFATYDDIDSNNP